MAVGLGHIDRRPGLVEHGHHHAEVVGNVWPRGLRRVARRGPDCRRRPAKWPGTAHGAHHHHWDRRVEQEVHQKAGFFQAIGALGDDHAVGGAAVGQFLNPASDVEPSGVKSELPTGGAIPPSGSPSSIPGAAAIDRRRSSQAPRRICLAPSRWSPNERTVIFGLAMAPSPRLRVRRRWPKAPPSASAVRGGPPAIDAAHRTCPDSEIGRYCRYAARPLGP